MSRRLPRLTDLQRKVLLTVAEFDQRVGTSLVAERVIYDGDSAARPNFDCYDPSDIRPVLRRLERKGFVREVLRAKHRRPSELMWECTEAGRAVAQGGRDR